MDRRNFLKLSAFGSVVAAAGNSSAILAPTAQNRRLEKHTISDIAFTTVRLRYPRQVGKNSHLDIHGWGPESGIHIIYTDRGEKGWGLNRASEKVTLERFGSIKGRKLSELIDPYNGVTDETLQVFDFSLFDLAGRVLRKPVYQLLGARKPMLFPCYSGMIYFDDLEPSDNPAGVGKIIEECRWDYNYGYRQFKLKIGRGYRWMNKDEGMKRDIEITKLVASEFPDCDILVDGNNGFTIDEFIAYLEGTGSVKLFWIEEPFHETVNDYIKLHSWLISGKPDTLLADGEASPDENVLGILSSQRIVRVLLQDISGYGFTRWIRKMRVLALAGTMASPHAWGSAIKTNYIAHLSGALGNTPTIEGVTCTSDDIDLSGYRLSNGKIIPSTGPGFGMDLLKKV